MLQDHQLSHAAFLLFRMQSSHSDLSLHMQTSVSMAIWFPDNFISFARPVPFLKLFVSLNSPRCPPDQAWRWGCLPSSHSGGSAGPASLMPPRSPPEESEVQNTNGISRVLPALLQAELHTQIRKLKRYLAEQDVHRECSSWNVEYRNIAEEWCKFVWVHGGGGDNQLQVRPPRHYLRKHDKNHSIF